MNIEQLVKELDTQLTNGYEEYVLLHEELNKHRGKPLDDTNLNEVNEIIQEIQDKFADIYHAYHYVCFRYQTSVNAVNSYNDFVETLKKVGATEYQRKEDIKN